MNGAAPNSIDWVLVASVIAGCAVVAAVMAAVSRGRRLPWAFVVLAAPWCSSTLVEPARCATQ